VPNARRFTLVCNPAARDSIARAAEARDALVAAGRDVVVLHSESPEHARDLARDAARDADGVVVAVGGDGTIGDVVNGILDAGASAPFGLIPSGTGNDTAKGLRVPIGLRGAVDVLLHSAARPADVLVANDRPFLGLGTLGFAADVGRSVNAWKAGPWRLTARALGRHLYRVTAAHHLLFRSAPFNCTVRAPDTTRGAFEWTGAALTVLIGNQPGVGGVFLPCPAATGDDGLLDVCIVRSRGPHGPLTLAQKARTLQAAVAGMHVELPWVDYFQAPGEVTFALDGQAAFVSDGDWRGDVGELRVRPWASALRIVAPPTPATPPGAPPAV